MKRFLLILSLISASIMTSGCSNVPSSTYCREVDGGEVVAKYKLWNLQSKDVEKLQEICSKSKILLTYFYDQENSSCDLVLRGNKENVISVLDKIREKGEKLNEKTINQNCDIIFIIKLYSIGTT